MSDRHRTLRRKVEAIRIDRGQSQSDCVDELVTMHGAPKRSQSSMSRYLSGRQAPPPGFLAAMERYAGSGWAAGDGGPAGHSGSSTDGFDDLVRDVTGEPMLGPRQGALLDAFIARLASGPSLSSFDWEAYRAAARQLGIEPSE